MNFAFKSFFKPEIGACFTSRGNLFIIIQRRTSLKLVQSLLFSENYRPVYSQHPRTNIKYCLKVSDTSCFYDLIEFKSH